MYGRAPCRCTATRTRNTSRITAGSRISFARALGGYPALVEQHQPLAVLSGDVEVVQHDDDGPARRVQAAEQLHDLQLVVEVQVVERLVEQQDRRLLGQRLRDEGALALAA